MPPRYQVRTVAGFEVVDTRSDHPTRALCRAETREAAQLVADGLNLLRPAWDSIYNLNGEECGDTFDQLEAWLDRADDRGHDPEAGQ